METSVSNNYGDFDPKAYVETYYDGNSANEGLKVFLSALNDVFIDGRSILI